MDKAYWNRIGSDYNTEIFDAYKEDRNGKLIATIRKYGNPMHTAIDFGCGTGKALPYLSPAFKKVLATDISSELLSQSKDLPYKNVTFKQADLAKPIKLPPADFAFCCNVAILPDLEKNMGIIRNVQKALRVSGSAVFVLPSLESALFSAWRLVDQYKREGVPLNKIPKSELSYFDGGKKELLKGLVRISGVATKHYLQPEIEALFADVKLPLKKIDKLEYNWTSEFADPPKWMGKPYPWDWIVECRKVR